MDLRLTAKVAATDEERAAIDEVLGPPPSQWQGGARRAEDAHVAFGGHAARGRRHLLITVLHAVQERVGVDQQDVAAARGGEAGVDARAEAAILGHLVDGRLRPRDAPAE